MTPAVFARATPFLAAVILVLASACQNPAADDKIPDTVQDQVQDDVQDDVNDDQPKDEVPVVTDSSKIGFEGPLTLTDYTFTDWDHASGSEAMVFSADTATFKTGAQSLKVQGTSLENQWDKPNHHVELIVPVGAASDFTGKTVTAQIYLPADSAVTGINLTFIEAVDANAKVWMVATQAGVTAGQWNTVSFTASDKGYATLDDLTSIGSLRFRFLTGSASATVSANVDSINW